MAENLVPLYISSLNFIFIVKQVIHSSAIKKSLENKKIRKEIRKLKREFLKAFC